MKHFCYFNLHKKVFSLKSKKTGLVEHHAVVVVLDDCKFKVSPAGRERVLREKRKNVHAGVEGQISGFEANDLSGFIELTYNPYKYDSFVVKETGIPVKTAERVVLSNKRVFARGIAG
jgi:hypothetical protein